MNWKILGQLVSLVCQVWQWVAKIKPTTGGFLIVEDNEDDAQWLQSKLAKRGQQSEIATSGETAAGLVAHTNYRCIFVDLRLPRLSGEALLRVLSKNAPSSTIVIVCGDTGDLSQLPKGQRIVYIAKPVTLEAIDDVLKTIP